MIKVRWNRYGNRWIKERYGNERDKSRRWERMKLMIY